MSIYLRDQLIAEAWVPAHLKQPQTDPRGPHYPVLVLGVVDDPAYRVNDKKFVDWVNWWPASKLWTITGVTLSDAGEVSDIAVKVTLWQPPIVAPENWP